MTIELQHKIGKKVSPDIKKSQLTIHRSQFTKKVLAFTLAETLIVMGIIGIVSALTLPNLNSSTGDKETVAKVKKIYQNLDDAFNRAVAVYGPTEVWFISGGSAEDNNNRFGDRITEFMKLSKNCRHVRSSGSCWTKSTTKKIGGSDWSDLGANDYYKFISADGTAYALVVGVTDSKYSSLNIYFDVDGVSKGKNTLGKDIFSVRYSVSGKEFKPSGIVGDNDNFKNSCLAATAGGSCAAWVIYNENMDYLKADTSGKCKNNTNITLDWTSNTTCK